MIEFTIPIRVNNPLNGSQGIGRGGRIARARKARSTRQLAHWKTQEHCTGMALVPPYAVTLTRIGKRKMDAGCGLNASLKNVRDGVAEALGVDDGDEAKITFAYAQEIGKAYAVRVRVETREAGTSAKQ